MTKREAQFGRVNLGAGSGRNAIFSAGRRCLALALAWLGSWLPLAVVAAINVTNTSQEVTLAQPLGVAGSGCSLGEAILTLNGTPPNQDCLDDGGGAVIHLPPGAVFNFSAAAASGPGGDSALPLPSLSVSLVGNGAVWQRDPTASAEFRFISVAAGLGLELTDLSLNGGVADEGGAVYAAGHLTLSQVRLSNNLAHTRGGAVYQSFTEGGSLFLQACALEGNRAGADGGALYLRHDPVISGGVFASASISRSLLRDNHAGGDGGAVFSAGTRFNLDSSLLTANRSAGDGGALSLQTSDAANLRANTLSANWAGDSGGAVATRELGDLQLVNNTLSGNQAEVNGGGLYLANPLGFATLLQNSVVLNSAGAAGGGLFQSEGKIDLGASILSANHSLDAPNCRSTGSLSLLGDKLYGFNSLGYNRFGDPADLDLNNCDASASTSVTGTDQFGEVLAELGPLQDNSGPTPTHALSPDSRLRNAIPATSAFQAVDQRGLARDARYDIGAYEYQSRTIIRITATPPRWRRVPPTPSIRRCSGLTRYATRLAASTATIRPPGRWV